MFYSLIKLLSCFRTTSGNEKSFCDTAEDQLIEFLKRCGLHKNDNAKKLLDHGFDDVSTPVSYTHLRAHETKANLARD